MTSSEDYLDSLLAGVNNKLDALEKGETIEENNAETLVADMQEESDFDISEIDNLNAILAEEDDTDTVNEPAPEVASEPEPAPAAPVDENKALSPDEIANLFATMGGNDEAPSSEPEPEVMPESVVVPEPEPAPAAPVDENKALSPDEIANLFASMGGNDENEVSEENNEEMSVTDTEDESLADREEVIETEEFVDMDEIDALLQDVSDLHPEREYKSSEDLEARISKYEENPEAAEEELMGDDDEDVAPEEVENEASQGETNSPEDDFLSSLEDVDAMLKEVEERANEEEKKISEKLGEGEDKDLDEINDILAKSDNNEAVNDELLSMIEGFEDKDDNDELAPESDEQTGEETDKKKKKKKSKDKKSSIESSDNAEGSDKKKEKKEKKEKKPGFFAKLFGSLIEEEEETEESENKEGEGEQTEEGKGKSAESKKKKGKGKDKGEAKADDNASIEAELDEEDKNAKKNKKGKKDKKDKKEKDKKNKKEKKPKKEKQTEGEPENTKSSIKKTGIIVSALFCLTVLGVVMFFAMVGPKVLARNEARVAFYAHDYETASNKLYGMKLSKSDELIYQKASLLYRLELFEKKADSYEVMGDKVLMLDALLATIKECDEVYVDAKFLTITEEVDVFRNDVEKRLYDEFGLTAEDISVINDMKPVYYTIAVKNVVNGVDYSTVDNNADNGQEEETLIEEQENEEILEDLLPEESAILNGEESE